MNDTRENEITPPKLPKGFPAGAENIYDISSQGLFASYKGRDRSRPECWAIHYMEQAADLKAKALAFAESCAEDVNFAKGRPGVCDDE